MQKNSFTDNGHINKLKYVGANMNHVPKTQTIHDRFHIDKPTTSPFFSPLFPIYLLRGKENYNLQKDNARKSILFLYIFILEQKKDTKWE